MSEWRKMIEAMLDAYGEACADGSSLKAERAAKAAVLEGFGRLERALEDARTVHLCDLVRALDDQQMLYGVTKNVVEGEIIDVVFALRDMGFKIDVPPEMEP